MLSNTGGKCAFPDGTWAFQLKTSSPIQVAFTPKPMAYSSRAELLGRGGEEGGDQDVPTLPSKARRFSQQTFTEWRET